MIFWKVLNMDEYVIGPSPIAKWFEHWKLRTLCCHYCMYSRMGINVYGQPYRILESASKSWKSASVDSWQVLGRTSWCFMTLEQPLESMCHVHWTAWHVSGLNSVGKKGLPRRQGGSWCAAVGLGWLQQRSLIFRCQKCMNPNQKPHFGHFGNLKSPWYWQNCTRLILTA